MKDRFLALCVALFFMGLHIPSASAFWEYTPPRAKPVEEMAPSEFPEGEAAELPVMPEPYTGSLEDIAPLCNIVDAGRPDMMPLVAETQQLLAITGHDPGGFDGSLSVQTQTAIRTYQIDAGLTPDGCISGPLIQQLRTMAPNPYYKKGTLSSEVLEVQILLTRLGYYIGPVDGVLGRKTRAAVEDFKKNHGVKSTNGPSSLIETLRQVYARRVRAE